MDRSEEGTGRLYYHALGHITLGEGGTAGRLLRELWDRREIVDTDEDRFGLIASAGVLYAAHLRVVGSDTDEPDPTTLLDETEPHREQLPPGSTALYERLTDGETDTSPEELQELAEEVDEELDTLELRAAVTFLTVLNQQ
jgi:hypothetical protein